MTRVARYVRYGRRSVEGWLSRGACDMILRIAEVQRAERVIGNVAEIGVHHGRLFILLHLLARPEETAVAIDLFEDQEANIDNSGNGDYLKFMENVARHVGVKSGTIVHKGDSTKLTGEMIKRMAGGPIRMFSVDGGHTETITKHDLETAQDSLSKGGVVILDDCFNGGWPGVVSGTLRFLDAAPAIRPFAIGANKTLFAAPDFCALYREALSSSLAKITTHDFLGHKVTCLDYEAHVGAILWLRHTAWWQHIKNTGMGAWLTRTYAKVQSLRG
jgi:hypothetical protein